MTTNPEPGSDDVLTVRELFMATFRWDGAAVVALMKGRTADLLPLQQAGAGLLVALAQEVEGSQLLAGEVIEALVERDAEGDDILAEQLRAATTGPPTGRRPVPADLEMLIDLLEGDTIYGFGGFLDLVSGSAYPENVFDDNPADEEDLDFEDPERWLRVPHVGSRDAWRDMRDFAATWPDKEMAERLLDAIDGRGAFSRFRRALGQDPDLVGAWLRFSDDRRAGRCRSWLASVGFDAVPPPPRP